jgi:hypothetical protein
MFLPKHSIRDGQAARRSRYDNGNFFTIHFDPGRTHFFGDLPYETISKCGTKDLQADVHQVVYFAEEPLLGVNLLKKITRCGIMQ